MNMKELDRGGRASLANGKKFWGLVDGIMDPVLSFSDI